MLPSHLSPGLPSKFQQHEREQQTQPKSEREPPGEAKPFRCSHLQISSSSSSSLPSPPLHVLDSRAGVPRRRWRHEAAGGGPPVAPALRALRVPAHHTPAAGGGGPGAAVAGVGGGGGVHAAGRVHGAHALRVGDLHAGFLPHALCHRSRLCVPLRRLRQQPLRDREGHPLARRRVLVLAEGGLHMAYIFQASIHADVKSNTK